MGQDSKTGGQGLYVEIIEIDPEGGENVVFPCNAWSEEDDLKSQKDIYPEPEYDGEPKPSTFLNHISSCRKFSIELSVVTVTCTVQLYI